MQRQSIAPEDLKLSRILVNKLKGSFYHRIAEFKLRSRIQITIQIKEFKQVQPPWYSIKMKTSFIDDIQQEEELNKYLCNKTYFARINHILLAIQILCENHRHHSIETSVCFEIWIVQFLKRYLQARSSECSFF